MQMCTLCTYSYHIDLETRKFPVVFETLLVPESHALVDGTLANVIVVLLRAVGGQNYARTPFNGNNDGSYF